LASVGKVMALGCTVVSIVTRAKSFVRSAPLACVLGLQLADVSGNYFECGCVHHDAITSADIFFFEIAIAGASFGWHK